MGHASTDPDKLPEVVGHATTDLNGLRIVTKIITQVAYKLHGCPLLKPIKKKLHALTGVKDKN